LDQIGNFSHGSCIIKPLDLSRIKCTNCLKEGLGEMTKLPIMLSVAVILAACSSPEGMSESIGIAQAKAHTPPSENAQQTLKRRVAAEAQAVNFEDNQQNGEAMRDFSYAWPAQASAIPALSRMLVQKRDEELAAQKSEWEQSVAEFGNGVEKGESEYSCITCINRSYSMNWSVTADTPHFLQLVGELYAYSGGAHGNMFFSTLMWDRNSTDDKAMLPVDLFVDPVALENVAFGEYCGALNVVRSQRRDVDPADVNPFDNCPSVADLVVTLTSGNGKHFDGITFLAAPYVAGSFAEGPYEFSIPITPTIMEVVKPQYRDHFMVGAG